MKITLEQWHTFKTVIDEGSFAKAAETLNKSQSSVSYIIARFQEQLPVAALAQEGRKAALTEAGKVLYRHASSLLTEAKQLEKTAAYLASGWEAEVAIAADALTPIPRLLCGLQAFSAISPHTRIRLFETTLSGTDEALLTRTADIVITGNIPPGFLGTQLDSITMAAIASCNHPLAKKTNLNEKDLTPHRQIVVRDSGIKRERSVGWLGAEQRWTVSSFATSIEAVKAGLGFAFLPLHHVETLLANGELVRLNLSTGSERTIPLNLIIGDQSNAGPAVQAVAQALMSHLKQ